MPRTEFGYARTECGCEACSAFCRYMPSNLIPADLDRIIPERWCRKCRRPMDGTTSYDGACACGGLIERTNPFRWAQFNLRASPGAIVSKGGKPFRIPTLVPAVKADGSCVHYRGGRCAIWDSAPFGCAFFDEHQAESRNTALAYLGLVSVAEAQADPMSLYRRLWEHLRALGLHAPGPETLRPKGEPCQNRP